MGFPWVILRGKPGSVPAHRRFRLGKRILILWLPPTFRLCLMVNRSILRPIQATLVVSTEKTKRGWPL